MGLTSNSVEPPHWPLSFRNITFISLPPAKASESLYPFHVRRGQFKGPIRIKYCSFKFDNVWLQNCDLWYVVIHQHDRTSKCRNYLYYKLRLCELSSCKQLFPKKQGRADVKREADVSFRLCKQWECKGGRSSLSDADIWKLIRKTQKGICDWH